MSSLLRPHAIRDDLNPWVPVCAGFIAAELTATAVSRLPPPGAQQLGSLALRAILFVVLTLAAGALATWLPARLSRRNPRPGTGTLILLAAPGWLLLPAIVILFREGSLWLLPLAAAAAWFAASGLERISWFTRQPAREFERRAQLNAQSAFNFASVYGLPKPEFNPAWKFFAAIMAAAAALFAINLLVPLAGIALAITIFLLVWRWRVLTDGRTWRLRSGAALGRFAGSAALLTLVALSLWRAGSAHGLGGPGFAHLRPAPRDAAHDATGGEGYRGIILLPPDEKKRPTISLPSNLSLHPQSAGPHHPLVIDFDGPYWYYKPPNHQPSRDAHVAHGRVTEVNVRSTDAAPVLMQAHQVLSDEIPLNCCSEIVLSVTNAENRPGEIALGLVLTDNSTSPQRSVYLGQKTLPGTELQRAFHDPFPESLHFAIPASARIAHFNQIDVVFVPSPARARTGARIAINTFTLMPR